MSLHSVMAPILIPLLAAALQLALGSRYRKLRSTISLLSAFGMLAAAMILMVMVTRADAPLVYAVGSWPATFAIVLVVDRLSALMLLLTAVVMLAVMAGTFGRWQRMGVFFQPLIQLLALGFNGAFLTGDLFNLFVFFEVLLTASYGLTLHGSGRHRVGAGLHYMAVNLLASMLFLLGLGLIYAAAGTLNMAMLGRMLGQVDGNTRTLLHVGGTLLALAFLTKAAVWPLGFWLPRTYAAATPPVAAMFALMTKLGLYVLLRLSRLMLGTTSAHFGSNWLLGAGIITLALGAIGMLGTRELGKLAGYCVLVSSGTLLSAFALHEPDVTAGALAYLVISVLAIATFFVLIGLLVPAHELEGVEQLAPYDPASDALFADEVERHVDAPAPVLMLATSFLACALLLVGLPPLSGFLAKYALLAPMVGQGIPGLLVLALIITAGLCTLIAMCRAGIQIFWTDAQQPFPHAGKGETVSVLALLGLCTILTVMVMPPWQYLEHTVHWLHQPQHYINAVLSSGAVS